MKLQNLILMAVAGISFTTFAAVETAGNSKRPLIIRSDTPARWFEESFVAGNGRIGASVYNGLRADSLSLNDITFWTGEPINPSKPFSPDAYKYIPAIREALAKGDYRAADSLQQQVQGKYSQNYQPVGKLLITYGGKTPTAIDRRLDLRTGLITSEVSDGKSSRKVRTFVSGPDSVIVINIHNPSLDTIRIQLKPSKALSITAKTPVKMAGFAAYDSRPVYSRGEGSFKYDPKRGVHLFSAMNVACPQGGNRRYADDMVTVTDAPEVTIVLSLVTSFTDAQSDPGYSQRYRGEALMNMWKAREKSFDAMFEAQSRDMSRYIDRVSLDLGATPEEIAALPTAEQLFRFTANKEANPDLEELYFQFGRYLLASCSRTPAVPANLQGLWNERVLPPWSSNYTTNINLEENYWGAENTNLSELHKPLLDFILMLSRTTGPESAKNYYGVKRGWCLGQNSDIWGLTNPVGEREGHPSWANWTMGGAWLATHIWDHYLYTLDKEDLKKYYPALKGAAEFCCDWLIEKDGRLITSPGTSPENLFIAPDGYVGSTDEGLTADLAIARQCMSDVLQAAQVLGYDNDFQQELTHKLSRLAPYRIGADGRLCEWGDEKLDYEPTHRHQSHLFGLYPGRHLTADSTPQLVKAASKSLDARGDKTTGWSTGWRINLRARAREAEKAYGMVRNLLKYVSPDGYKGEDARRGGGTYPNLLDAHSPFQIDGNFGGSAGMAEMLMQSSYSGLPGDKAMIDILPALPAQWKDGSIKGLVARGAYLVDIVWKNSRPVSVTLTALSPLSPDVKVNGVAKKLVKVNKYQK